MNILTQDHIGRFWGKVNKEISTIFYNGTRCWEWTAGCFQNGYGAIKVGGNNKGAHRISYEINLGEIPNGLHVLHHCDNRRCVNPDHLFLGTPKDNVDDKVRKGRQARGEKSGHYKVTEEQVSEIRRRYGYKGRDGETQESLAKEFGITHKQVSNIVNYKLWK